MICVKMYLWSSILKAIVKRPVIVTLCRGMCPDASRRVSFHANSRWTSCRVVAAVKLAIVQIINKGWTYFVLVHHIDLVPFSHIPNTQPSVPILWQFLVGTSLKTSQISPCVYHSSRLPPGSASKIECLYNNSRMGFMINNDKNETHMKG